MAVSAIAGGPPAGWRNMAQCYPNIWSITNVLPHMRLQRPPFGPAILGMLGPVPGPPVPVGYAQMQWDDHVRQAHRAFNPSIRQPARCMTGPERRDILTDLAGYVPRYGAAPGVPAVTVTKLTRRSYGIPRGCFLDRLPEFLCQLGDKTTLGQYVWGVAEKNVR